MTNLKKVFLVMLVVILLGATVVFATDDVITITQENTITGGNTVSNTQTNTVENTIIQGGNTYSNTTNLPQTGANDYAVISIIAVFAVSAVYAYKNKRLQKHLIINNDKI